MELKVPTMIRDPLTCTIEQYSLISNILNPLAVKIEVVKLIQVLQLFRLQHFKIFSNITLSTLLSNVSVLERPMH